MTPRIRSAEHLAHVQAILGEGPVWDVHRRCLWFVDLLAPAVLQYDPSTRALKSWNAPAKAGWILPREDGSLIAGLADGLYLFSETGGVFRKIFTVEDAWPDNRLNDAGLAPDGSIWFGTMDDRELEATGHYYRYDQGKPVRLAISPVTVTNGPAVSGDGKTLLVVDTLGGFVDAYPIVAGTQLGARRRLVHIDANLGYPDGVTFDAEGGFWLGIWGGWAAHRYDREGRLTDIVRFPVAKITKIALGGEDGRTAFVTTSGKSLSASERKDQPLAGDLFTFRADIPAARQA